MTVTINGNTGVSQCQPGSVSPDDLASGVVLGTVSQTAGVPTGAIIEAGGNSTHGYTRDASGMQVSLITFDTGAISNASGSVWNSNAVFPGNFLKPFIGIPAVTASASPYGVATGIFWAGGWQAPSVSAWGGWLGMSHASNGAFSTIRLVAVGRWF